MMRLRSTIFAFGWCLLLTLTAAADEPAVKHRLMLIEYGERNRLVEVSADGKLTWEHPTVSVCVNFQPLASGNVVYAYGGNPTGVQEVDRGHKIVWNYVSQCHQVLGFERMANGNTLLAEQGPCRGVEVNPQGEVVSTVNMPTTEQDAHRQARRIHRLDNGHTLVAHEGEAAAREYDAQGKAVWEYRGVENIYEARRLANGNTVIGCGTQERVIEVTPDGKIAWEFTAADAPELNLTWITSVQPLKNGNLVVGNFLRGREGKGAHAFEVTRDKKVVWKFTDHDMIKTATMANVLDD